MASAIPEVCAFTQEECFRLGHHLEQEGNAAGIQHLLLHERQFDIEDFSKLFRLKLMENHHAVEPVHELGRKLAACCFDCGTFELEIYGVSGAGGRLDKAHALTD